MVYFQVIRQKVVFKRQLVCEQVEVRDCQPMTPHEASRDVTSTENVFGDDSSKEENPSHGQASHDISAQSSQSSQSSQNCTYVPKTRCKPTQHCRDEICKKASIKTTRHLGRAGARTQDQLDQWLTLMYRGIRH